MRTSPLAALFALAALAMLRVVGAGEIYCNHEGKDCSDRPWPGAVTVHTANAAEPQPATAPADSPGKAPPAPGTPPGLPFAIHHHMLTQMGIHHLENTKLDELARDHVWTSCTIILPLLEKGAAGSAIRPVAYGVPGH